MEYLSRQGLRGLARMIDLGYLPAGVTLRPRGPLTPKLEALKARMIKSGRWAELERFTNSRPSDRAPRKSPPQPKP